MNNGSIPGFSSWFPCTQILNGSGIDRYIVKGLKEFLNFFLHYVPKIGIHSSLRLAHMPRVTFDINVVGAQIRRDALHVCVLPGKCPLMFFLEID